MKLAEIAARLECQLEGEGEVEITGVTGMDEATPSQLTFLANPKYRSKLRTTRARLVCCIAFHGYPRSPWSCSLRTGDSTLAREERRRGRRGEPLKII